MKPKSLSIGINYWLKDKLLTETEIGEYAQFWLGAYTEVNFDQNKRHNPKCVKFYSGETQ